MIINNIYNPHPIRHASVYPSRHCFSCHGHHQISYCDNPDSYSSWHLHNVIVATITYCSCRDNHIMSYCDNHAPLFSHRSPCCSLRQLHIIIVTTITFCHCRDSHIQSLSRQPHTIVVVTLLPHRSRDNYTVSSPLESILTSSSISCHVPYYVLATKHYC